MPKSKTYIVATTAIELYGHRWVQGESVSHDELISLGQTEADIESLLEDGSLTKED